MSKEMKDSGIEWIGDIPTHWEKRKFKTVMSYVVDNRGKTPPLSESGIPMLEIDSLTNKHPDISKISKFISQETYDEFLRKYLESGDILFATVGSIGKTSIVPDEFNYCIAQNIVGFRVNVCQNNMFWFYYMNSDAFRQTYLQFNKENIQGSIKVSNLMNGIVIIPPYEEQEKIAVYLEKKLDNIDDIINKTNQTIDEYKKYKYALITKCVTKGINKNVDVKSTDVDWIGQVPQEWECMKLKYIFSIKKDIAGKEGFDILSVTQSGLKIKDISKNEGQISADYSKYQIVEKGDFVMNHMDLLTGWVDCSKYYGVTSPDYRVFKFKNPELYSPEYYTYIMQICYKNKIFYGLGQGVSNLGRWRLQTDKFLNFMLPVPPKDEQEQIVNYLDNKCIEIDNIIEQKQKLLIEIEAYKKSLIYECVTGKREVK